MFVCPKCDCALNMVKGTAGIFYHCPSCDGRSATLALLRKSVPAKVVNELWQLARSGDFARERICPACDKRMAEVPASTEQGLLYLDVCTVCQVVWFDYGEYGAMPSVPHEFSWKDNLSQEAREKLALFEIEAIRERAKAGEFEDFTPDAWWHWIPGFLVLSEVG